MGMATIPGIGQAAGLILLGYESYQVAKFIHKKYLESISNKNKLTPDENSKGEHSTYRRDPNTGKITNYETWENQSNPKDPKNWKSRKRFDGKGASHFNKKTGEDVPTPHTHDPSVPGGVRKPTTDEKPK